jgi:hypothetical protein
MYGEEGLSKHRIARELNVSRTFVIKWTSPDQNPSEDHRGWKRGTRRKWDEMTEKRLHNIYTSLQADPRQFYCGPTALAQEWKKRYPTTASPPLRTIGQMLSDMGLSEKKKGRRNKGAARYLCYPEHTIYTLFGTRVLEADFIGRKFIAGRTQPINFIGFSFKKEPRLRYFARIDAQTADNFIHACTSFFSRFETPDHIKLDNALAVIGSASGKRNISRAMAFLLEQKVVPIFAVPRKPFSQASIEGNNSVFSRKFWNCRYFMTLSDIDTQLDWFNDASLRYTGYQPLIRPEASFKPVIYFTRQVKENGAGSGYIDVLNERILLPAALCNYFVLAKWDLPEEKLSVYFEKDLQPEIIEKVTFRINERSKNTLRGW